MAGSTALPSVGERHAGGEVAGGGCEHVTAGERRAGRGELVVGVVERDHRPGATGHRHRRGEQAVVGAEQHAAGHLHADQAAAGAHARVDDRDDHAVVGQVLHRPHQHERARPHVVGRDLVADVEDAHVGREAEHDRLAHPDELVGVAVVGRERDQHGSTLSARTPCFHPRP